MFNENEKFDGRKKTFINKLRTILPEDLEELLRQIHLPKLYVEPRLFTTSDTYEEEEGNPLQRV